MRKTFTFNIAIMETNPGGALMTSPRRVTTLRWIAVRGTFLAWAKNEPNNFNEEDCVHALGVKYNYEWNDVKCRDCHHYTCKKGRMLRKLFSFI